MNFQDFFRSFIGLNSNNNHYRPRDEYIDPVNKFRNPPWGDDPDEDDDFDELYSDYRGSSNSPFGFNMFTGNPMDIHKYFEQQMNEMMRTFGSFGLGPSLFGSGLNELPDADLENDIGKNSTRNADIRDRYLKTPGNPRFATSDNKTDSDIDDRVNSDGISSLFKKEESGRTALSPVPHHYSRSFSSRVIISNNGKVEERVKEWTSDGTERESIRRTLGDQTHFVTTSKGKSGQVEQEEQLINIQQDSVSDFDKKWSNGSDLPSSSGYSRTPVIVDPHEGSLGIFSSIFKLFS